MFTMVCDAVKWLLACIVPARRWRRRSLVLGPDQPVDGDSVSCTKALIAHLRKLGLEAYTLPVLHMYPQLRWILDRSDLHPATLPFATDELTTFSPQQAYDALLKVWRPDEIVLVDGQRNRLGFDPRGVPIFEIDHHLDKGARDDSEAYIQSAPSAGCLLIEKYGVYEFILVVSILTDTFWLRKNMPARAIDALYALRKHGLTDEVLATIQSNLMVPKDPAVLAALRSADMRYQGRSVFVALTTREPELHRDVVALLGYYFDNICVVRGDGYVSFVTKCRSKSVRQLAIEYGGGGHDDAAAGHVNAMDQSELNELYTDFVAEFAGCHR